MSDCIIEVEVVNPLPLEVNVESTAPEDVVVVLPGIEGIQGIPGPVGPPGTGLAMPGGGSGIVAPVLATNLALDPHCTTLTGKAAGPGTGGTAALSLKTDGGYAGETNYVRATWSVASTNAPGAVGGYIAYQRNTAIAPISAGQTVSVNWGGRTSITGGNFQLLLEYHQGATILRTDTFKLGTFAANTWTGITGSSVAPANTDGVTIFLQPMNGTNFGVGDTLDVSAPMFSISSKPEAFCAGNQAGCRWTGTANASTTERLMVRQADRDQTLANTLSKSVNANGNGTVAPVLLTNQHTIYRVTSLTQTALPFASNNSSLYSVTAASGPSVTGTGLVTQSVRTTTTPTVVVSSVYFSDFALGYPYQVRAGDRVFVACKASVLNAAASCNGQMTISVRDAANAVIGSTLAGPMRPIGSDGLIWATLTIPATGSPDHIAVANQVSLSTGTTVGGETVQWDAPIVVRNPPLGFQPSYFDGSQPGARWKGLPWASASELIMERQQDMFDIKLGDRVDGQMMVADSSKPNGWRMTSAGFYEGVPFPNGLIPAPVGSTYTHLDLTVSNGCRRWFKATGTGTSGWVVDSGDTDWQTAVSWNASGTITKGRLPAEWVPRTGYAGFIQFCRTNKTIFVQIVNLQAAASNTSVAIYTAPTGLNAFKQGGAQVPLTFNLVGSSVAARRTYNVALIRGNGEALSAGDYIVGTEFSYTADSSVWPAAL